MRACTLLLLLTASAAGALPGHLHRPYLLPAAPAPLSGGCAWSARLDIANEHNIDPPEGGVYAQVDAETWLLTLGARAATPAGEFGVSVPFAAVWGGLLDRPLNAFHAAVGLHSLTHPPGDVVAFAQRGEQLAVQTGPAAGPGDPVIWWGRARGPWSGSALLAAPLGTRAQFISAGAWRAGAQLAYAAPTWGARALLSVPLNGAHTTLAFLEPRAALNVTVWRDLPSGARVTADVQSSPFAVPGRYGGLNAGLRVSLGGLSFAEDAVSPRPDVTFGAQTERRACP